MGVFIDEAYTTGNSVIIRPNDSVCGIHFGESPLRFCAIYARTITERAYMDRETKITRHYSSLVDVLSIDDKIIGFQLFGIEGVLTTLIFGSTSCRLGTNLDRYNLTHLMSDLTLVGGNEHYISKQCSIDVQMRGDKLVVMGIYSPEYFNKEMIKWQTGHQ